MSKVKKTSKKLSRSSIDKDFDIKVKEIKYQKSDELHGSMLTLEFSGADINIPIINTIRRVSMDDIPIYAFPPELIKIEGNTSIFNNDYMKLRLSQIPILDLDSNLDYLDRKYINTNINFGDQEYVKYEKEKVIEIYINSYNNTPENMNVTTNDIKYIEDGEPVTKYSTKYPILITQLRPNETFKAYMKAALSIGLRSNIFSASSNTYYDENDGKITLMIESQGQIKEFVIIEKSIKYILKKLDDFEDNFKEQLKESKKYEKNSTQVYEFANEDNTMGEILNNTFQDHPKIIFSGLSKPSSLERLIRIKIASSDENPLEYMLESIDHLKKVYNQLLKEIKH
jgi:DNA-directed RNA polymerase subunit L